MDSDQIEQVAPTEAAAPAAELPAAAADSGIDDLLAEYDRATEKPAPEPKAAPAGSDLYEWERDLADMRTREQIDTLTRESESSSAALAQAEQRAAELEQHAQQEAFRQWHNRESAELTELAARMQADGEQVNPNIHDRYALRYLLERRVTDEKLVELWDHRHDSPESKWLYVRYLQQNVMRDYEREIRSLPDKDASEDRELVTWAVKNGSTGKIPESPPPNLGRMNTAEFRAYTRDLGFESGV